MESHCLELAAELARRWIAVTVVVPCAGMFDVLASRLRSTGAEVERIDADARNGRIEEARSLFQFARLVRRVRPDVIHLHTGGATGGVAVVALARLLSTATVVVTEHDVPDTHPFLYQRLGRLVLDRLMHTLVSVSRRNAALRRERLGVGARAVVTVLNGVAIQNIPTGVWEEERGHIRGQFGIRSDTVVIGSLVRLAPGKGLPDLLRAFALVRPGTDCELLLVGDGPLRSELEALAEQLGIADVVHFAGYQVESLPFLTAFDVFVLAVPFGSMSIALLEAMVAGLPPVITFCGPEEAVIPEVTGLSAPPSDPVGLADSLSRLVRSPELRAELGASAAIHVRRHYSVERVVIDLLDVYRGGKTGSIPERLRATNPPNPYADGSDLLNRSVTY